MISKPWGMAALPVYFQSLALLFILIFGSSGTPVQGHEATLGKCSATKPCSQLLVSLKNIVWMSSLENMLIALFFCQWMMLSTKIHGLWRCRKCSGLNGASLWYLLLSTLNKHHIQGGGEMVRTRGVERVLPNNIFWTLWDYCACKLWLPPKDQASQHSSMTEGKIHEALTLEEKLVTVDDLWKRESRFSLGIWTLVCWPSSSGWLLHQAHLGRNNFGMRIWEGFGKCYRGEIWNGYDQNRL